jgi:hypothetical protein
MTAMYKPVAVSWSTVATLSPALALFAVPAAEHKLSVIAIRRATALATQHHVRIKVSIAIWRLRCAPPNDVASSVDVEC